MAQKSKGTFVTYRSWMMTKMEIIKNEKTAEIVGLCLGDGSLTRRHTGHNKGRLRFQLRGHIEDDRDHYDIFVKPLFDELIDEIPLITCVGNTPSYGVSTEKIKICNYLRKLGVPVGVKQNIQIPAWILKNKFYSAAFIRGFTDTEGSVFATKDSKGRHTRIRMSIVNTSALMISQISKILTGLGVSNIVVKPYKGKSTINKIQIADSNVKIYFMLIGSNNPKHVTKYNLWKATGRYTPRTTLQERKHLLKEFPSVNNSNILRGWLSLVKSATLRLESSLLTKG